MFLWVNKTASSSSLSNERGSSGDQNTVSSVWSHAQKVTWAKKKQDRMRPLSHAESAVSSKPTKVPPAEHRRWSLATAAPLERDYGFDALGVFPLALDTHDMSLMQFFMALSSDSGPRSNEKTDSASFPFLRIPPVVLRTHAQGAMINSMTMASLLAWLASYSDNFRHPSRVKMSEKRMARALRTMQTHLSHRPAVTSALLLAVIHLVAAEADRGNFSSARIHLLAARKFMGDLQPIDVFTRHLLHVRDTRVAAEQSSRPIIPQGFDQGPFSTAEELRTRFHDTCLAMQETGQGFTSSPSSSPDDELPIPMLDIISQMSEYLKLHQGYLMEPGIDLRITRWIQLQREASRHALLSLEVDTPQLEPLRITLLIWSFTSQPRQLDTLDNRTITALVSHLKAALTSPPAWTWSETCQDQLRWIFVSGALAAEYSDKQEWFTRQVRRCFEDCTDQETCWADMRAIVGRFLFLDWVHGASLRRLAQEVVAQNSTDGTITRAGDSPSGDSEG